MPHGLNNNFLYAVVRFNLEIELQGTVYECGGTGFCIEKDGIPFLFSNRHVLQPDYDDPQFKGYKLNKISFYHTRYDENSNKTSCEKVEIKNFDRVIPDNDKDDIECLYNLSLETQNAQGLLPIPFSFLATEEIFKNQLSIGDPIVMIGYPELYDHKNNTPLTRGGIISSDPRLDYSYDSADRGHMMLYEGFSTSGASGSPVFATQIGFPVRGMITSGEGFYRPTYLIGINAGNLRGVEKMTELGKGKQYIERKFLKHHNLSYMFKSDQLIKLIEKAEAKMNNK